MFEFWICRGGVPDAEARRRLAAASSISRERERERSLNNKHLLRDADTLGYALCRRPPTIAHCKYNNSSMNQLIKNGWLKAHDQCIKARGSRLMAHGRENLARHAPWATSLEPWALGHGPLTMNCQSINYLLFNSKVSNLGIRFYGELSLGKPQDLVIFCHWRMVMSCCWMSCLWLPPAWGTGWWAVAYPCKFWGSSWSCLDTFGCCLRTLEVFYFHPNFVFIPTPCYNVSIDRRTNN